MDRRESVRTAKRVFVSYSRRDSSVVRQLVDGLERRGHDVWIDVEDISVGAWAGRIVDAIRQSDVFLLVITQAATASLEVAKEVSLAANRHVPIIPVMVAPPAEIPSEIAYHIAGQQRITFDPRDPVSGVRAVIRAVEGSTTQGQVRAGRALVGGAVTVVVLGLIASVVVTAVTGRLPPWTSATQCSNINGEVVSAQPATFVNLSGAALEIAFRNTSGRQVGLPAHDGVAVTGATGTQYQLEQGLVNGGWFLSETVAPESTRTLALGISGNPPAGGQDRVTVHVAGAQEHPIPFLRCDVDTAPIDVQFAQ
jgi:hypothetical protein